MFYFDIFIWNRYIQTDNFFFFLFVIIVVFVVVRDPFGDFYIFIIILFLVVVNSIPMKKKNIFVSFAKQNRCIQPIKPYFLLLLKNF